MVTRDFDFEGHRFVYDEYGNGDRVVVLLPGLLFSRRMHRPLAETLAQRGHRVICLDLLGHGDSDRPPEMGNYSMTIFGRSGRVFTSLSSCSNIGFRSSANFAQ